jgi:hypothetical protein
VIHIISERVLLFRVYELRHAAEAVLVSEIINQAVVSERLSELELEQKQGNFHMRITRNQG